MMAVRSFNAGFSSSPVCKHGVISCKMKFNIHITSRSELKVEYTAKSVKEILKMKLIWE